MTKSFAEPATRLAPKCATRPKGPDRLRMRDQGPFQFWSEVRQGGHEAHKHRGVKRRNRFPGVPQWTTTAGFHGLTPDLATGGGLGALRATHLPYLQQEEYLAPILAVVIILPSESAGHSRSALARQERPSFEVLHRSSTIAVA